MMISFIKGKKLSYLAPREKKILPVLLNHERTVINPIILESRVKFH